jgi:hypothetical protein
MAWYPGAIRKVVERHKTPMARYRGVCNHVAVSESASLFGYFNQDGNPTSHFYVRKDGTCLTPENRVLTADLRWVPIGSLSPGDRLIGFDEGGAAIGGGRRYRESVVEIVTWAAESVYGVVLDTEQVIYATADHRWLAQANKSWTWRTTKLPDGRSLVGSTIPKLFEPWRDASDFDGGWLSGLLDGEGTVADHHRVGFSQRPGPVLDRALALLEKRNVTCSIRPVSGSNDCLYVDVNGGLAARLALLGELRPVRLLGKVTPDTFGQIRSNRDLLGADKVLAVYPAGVRDIVRVQTSTRTFIAEGYAMHNCEQYVDTQYRAPAQLEGNSSMISIETQGGVDNIDTEPWTAAQVERLASIARWTHQVHGIPLVRMANSLPETRGIGYHRLGIDPWRVDGGELWSRAYGKVCPGNGKIAQIPHIIERANQSAEGDGTMAWTDAQISAMLAYLKETTDTVNEVARLLRTQALRMDSLVNKQLPDLRADIDAVRKSVSLTATRLDYLANNAVPLIKADVDAIRDRVATPDVDTAADTGDSPES